MSSGIRGGILGGASTARLHSVSGSSVMPGTRQKAKAKRRKARKVARKAKQAQVARARKKPRHNTYYQWR